MILKYIDFFHYLCLYIHIYAILPIEIVIYLKYNANKDKNNQ